jgi:cytochrome b561
MWDSTVKALHWTLVLMIAFEIPAGFVMASTYGPSFKDERVLGVHNLASQIHHTVGYLVLAAALVWMAWRSRHARPSRDVGTSAAERVLAACTHATLAALLVIVPLSGWAALSALADSPAFGVTHRWFFGWDGVLPRIWKPLPFNDPNGYALFARVHITALWVGAGVLALHVLAALWHHAVRKDGVLRRMWPLASERT